LSSRIDTNTLDRPFAELIADSSQSEHDGLSNPLILDASTKSMAFNRVNVRAHNVASGLNHQHRLVKRSALAEVVRALTVVATPSCFSHFDAELKHGCQS
jgi:hypothetical protein